MRHILMRSIVVGFGLLLSLFGLQAQETAGGFPAKPVRVILTFPAGGGVDVIARVLTQKLTESTGQQFIVDNKPGAGGIIAADMVAKSAPDGYTLLFALDTVLTVTPHLYRNTPFDSIKDFAPISLVAESPLVVLTSPSANIGSLAELIKRAKANPGTMNFGSGGSGSSGHLAAELMNNMAGIKMTHVPYKGGPQVLTDLAGGQVQMTVLSLAASVTMVKAGKANLVAVTGANRLPGYPEVPTVSEAGLPGYQAGFWVGLLAPAGTPRPVVNKLRDEVQKVLNNPELRQQFQNNGVTPVGNTPEQFATVIDSDKKKWGEVIRLKDIKAD
ncbi:MAG: tripartite tricarboxylate transporter substrate binding protein [Burkholderiales bacterium]|nr:tripartite tricarboxylate transporter substrate binding protein [Burkholderiales bacterium]